MNKHLVCILRIFLQFLLCMALPLVACTEKEKTTETPPDVTAHDTTAAETEPDITVAETPTAPDETEPVTTESSTDTVTEPETEPETEPPVDPIDPATFGKADITYICDDASILSTYNGKNADDYKGVCAYYKQEGYTVYSTNDMGGNLATTMVKGSAMAHIYWHPHNEELNVVLSDSAAATLPPATPEIIDGDYKCTITQIKDTQNFIGMGYVIQLKDGSFIIYDGSFANQTAHLISTILGMHKGEGKPIIRAWLLTHSHNDHYPAFETVATTRSYREQLVVEHVIVAPMNDEKFSLDSGECSYLSGKFYEDVANLDTKVVFAHTGMTFKFCNLNMEIIFSPESYYKTTSTVSNFNSTSIVSRLYDDSYSALFLGDSSTKAVPVYLQAYGDYLKSDICQMSHHGVEADYILELYDTVKPQIMFYPASIALFTSSEPQYNPQVHSALLSRDYLKEILLHGVDQFTREWGTKFDADAPLTITGYIETDPVIGTNVSIQNGTGTNAALSVTDWIAYRVRVNGEITGFSFSMPTWHTTGSACTLAVYKWDTDITKSLEAEPLASKRIENLIDNATNRMNLNPTLKEGEYLFVIQDVVGRVGVYYNKGSTGGVGKFYTPNGVQNEQPSLKIAFADLPEVPFGASTIVLTTDKTIYTEGESILVTASSYKKDWVAITKKGETTPIRRWYLHPTTDDVYNPDDHVFELKSGEGKLLAGTYTLYIMADGAKIGKDDPLMTLDITITSAEE